MNRRTDSVDEVPRGFKEREVKQRMAGNKQRGKEGGHTDFS